MTTLIRCQGWPTWAITLVARPIAALIPDHAQETRATEWHNKDVLLGVVILLILSISGVFLLFPMFTRLSRKHFQIGRVKMGRMSTIVGPLCLHKYSKAHQSRS